MHPYQLSIEEVLAELKSARGGLGSTEAHRLLGQYGPNELVEKKKKTVFMMFLDQFKDFMIIVLLAAAVISGFLGEAADTIAIIVIVVLNAALGFSQEYRAEKAMAALKKMAASSAVVMRDGAAATIPASDLVPGDVVLLEAGKVVPADLRIIEAAQLRAEEAALTGESVPVEKHVKELREASLPLGDRKNMLYKGTFVTYGRGAGVVTATGMETELGRIAAMLQDEGEMKTPLQKRLEVFGRGLAYAVLAICSVVFLVGILRGEQAVLMLLTAISLAVAAIPEALPAVITISLALGAKKMVKQNALIRKLPAVETLGSVTYICSDKTGTLTQNRMTVEEMWVDEEVLRISDSPTMPGQVGLRNVPSPWPSPQSGEGAAFIPQSAIRNPKLMFLTALAVSNDARVEAGGAVLGDPTEIALYNAAKANGFDKHALEQELPRVAELAFDSERKLMTTFHRTGREGEKDAPRFISFTKGAIDVLLGRSTALLTSSGLTPLDAAGIMRTGDRMAAEGLRVLGIAMKQWDALPVDPSHEVAESGLTLLGLVGMMDPPREEARSAVSLCRTAGIKPVMITGDHPLTAQVVARRLGILDDGVKAVMTGRELEKLPLQQFEERVEHVCVYARVAPEQKLKIVKALQDRGQFVAMTGDGVNDAPALKRADIGVAMGVTGTDVSKESADMILLDDNFSTIVKAVKEGRRIFDNIRKFIKYTMTSNSGEIWTIFLAPFLGLPIPLLPIHILWINLVTDGLPGLALAAEPAEKGVMQRPPRHPKESIFSHGLGLHIIWVGLLMGAASLVMQAWAIRTGHAHWQTMVFTVLCLSQMGHVLAIRSDRESVFTQGFFSNKPMVGAFLLTFALQMATIYAPFLNPIFKTEPLSPGELFITLAMSSIVFVAVELEKYVKRRSGGR